jgi:arginase
VHEPSEAPANQYAGPGGLSAATVRDLVRAVSDRFSIVAAALTSYDPTCDPRMLDVALRLIEEVATR